MAQTPISTQYFQHTQNTKLPRSNNFTAQNNIKNLTIQHKTLKKNCSHTDHSNKNTSTHHKTKTKTLKNKKCNECESSTKNSQKKFIFPESYYFLSNQTEHCTEIKNSKPFFEVAKKKKKNFPQYLDGARASRRGREKKTPWLEEKKDKEKDEKKHNYNNYNNNHNDDNIALYHRHRPRTLSLSLSLLSLFLSLPPRIDR